MAVFRVERTSDYTVMSNYHLRDKRLSLKGKGADPDALATGRLGLYLGWPLLYQLGALATNTKVASVSKMAKGI